MKREKVTKLSDYQPGVQPVDYHKFDEDQREKALKRGERIAWMIAPMIATVVGLAVVTLILLVR